MVKVKREVGELPYVGFVYRHYRGGYCLVESVSSRIDAFSDALLVTYRYLDNKEEMWTETLNEFMKEAPDNEENEFGQEYVFELVLDLEDRLSLVSTEKLVRELVNRDDNPYRNVDIEESKKKVVNECYHVGGYAGYYTNEEIMINDFNVKAVFNTKEEAMKYLENHCAFSCDTMLRVVSYKEELN